MESGLYCENMSHLPRKRPARNAAPACC